MVEVNPKIVVAIPYYESDMGKRDVLKNCINSLKGHDDILILAGKAPTLPDAWNNCIDLAFSLGAEYVVVSNDDVELVEGTLDVLCVPDSVVSPLVDGGVFKVFHAHMFCLPKLVYDKVGKFDNRFQIYWSDTDYAKRLMDAHIPVLTEPKVNILHKEPARTLKSYPESMQHEDRTKFIEKWGRTYEDPVRECI